jgi:hypothetical protein
MFDLVSDPLEIHNLLEAGQTHQELPALQHKLKQWQLSVGDPLAGH